VELDRGDWSASYPGQSIPLEFSQGNKLKKKKYAIIVR